MNKQRLIKPARWSSIKVFSLV